MLGMLQTLVTLVVTTLGVHADAGPVALAAAVGIAGLAAVAAVACIRAMAAHTAALSARARGRAFGFVRILPALSGQLDPDADGHARPRAPGRLLPTA